MTESGHHPGTNYTEQGAARTVIGGTLEIPSAGGGVTIDGAAVTPADAMVGVTASAAEINVLDGIAATLTAAELSILDGVTATAAEINTLAGVTLGTVIASKVATVDASLNMTGINNLTTTGNATLGNAAGDTFKVHGAAGSGAQSAFVAQLAAFTDPPSAAEMALLRTAVNSILTCEINHGLRAAS